MAQIRRRDPEPPPGPPRIEFKPGMANEMLRELAPLLAEEGIDLDDVPDMETLQRAMNRAVERHNMTLFTPVGTTREVAAAALRLVVEALAQDDTTLASAILDQVQPESPDNSAPTVSACIGITLGLLDNWLSGTDPTTPPRLGDRVRLPNGHWQGERAARDILALAGKGRAFRSLNLLITRQGGPQILHGSALALTATIRAWSNDTGASGRPCSHRYPLTARVPSHQGSPCCDDRWNPPQTSFTEQRNGRTCPGALLWVADHGTYLMSNGRPGLRVDPNDRTSAHVVVYAQGWTPDTTKTLPTPTSVATTSPNTYTSPRQHPASRHYSTNSETARPPATATSG